MLFMVIVCFRDHDMIPIYRRLREAGRKLPDGLRYVDSWVEPSFYSSTRARRRALPITETELSIIAAAAIIGESIAPVSG